MRQLILFPVLLLVWSANAQRQPLGPNQYFKNNFNGIVKSLPVINRWVDDDHYIQNGKTIQAATGQEVTLSSTSSKKLPIVSVRSNDLYYSLDGAEKRLTQDADVEINPVLSPDGQYVAYTKNNDLYVVSVVDARETRLTNDGSELILNGYASWVYMEEILGRASQYRAFWWSPDSKTIAFFRSDDTQVPEFVMTDAPGTHGTITRLRYPKVGDPNPSVKIGMVSSQGGRIVWADFNETDDQYFGLPYWKPDGQTLLVQWMNRKQNQLKIWAVNPANGSKALFMTEEQKTWINLDDEGNRIRFLNNGTGFIYRSDANGYDQLYLYDMNGRLKNPINTGNTIVTDVEYVDEKNKWVYFLARKENTARTDFYRASFSGKKQQRLTFGEYHHSSILLSPNARYFITTYGNAETPDRMTLLNTNGKLIRELGDSKGDAFDQTALARTQLIRVPSEDGLFSLPMKVTWPVNMEKGKKYPVLVSIYGGPNAGRVWDSWALSGSQQWYAREGLIQVAMDHRASGHFGKAGVNYMYHNLGYWEMKDYATMVKWLVENGQADPTKIAITGFSYGGYLSCYALTYGADVFTHAMAGGSVIDWALYDSHYTERYMGTPADNPEGYRSSSVLTHVKNYKGMLQLVHGIVDENVHMQNSIRLASALQDIKKDFEFMTYSGGRHGWGGAKGAHFQNLKTRFIYKHLLEKPVQEDLLR